MFQLTAGDYALTIAPEIGGSLQSFTWRGEPLMRTAEGNSVLDAACFPLVPFSNRIANGRFEWEGRTVQLSSNFGGADQPHALHGFGWTSVWEVISQGDCSVELEHRYPGGEWPWTYVARQKVKLTEGGLVLKLSVTNQSENRMPVGLGFHPYFPRNDRTQLSALHTGEWQNDSQHLPASLTEMQEPVDWWQGQTVASRIVDTVYVRRHGPIQMCWPDRNLRLNIECSPELKQTAIYVPKDANWFCVEPISHETNALNRNPLGMRALAGGEEISLQCRVSVETCVKT
jgi:aldose 1-epimerase